MAEVSLHVYDLSQGLARKLSTTFLGKSIDAIWHTGIVVFGKEYYFGRGIQVHSPTGTTPYGAPVKVVELGITHIDKDIFEIYLYEISRQYTTKTYSLLYHNCNNFSNEVSQFLVGAAIPDYILNLPKEVINSPMGPLMLPMIRKLEVTLKIGAVPHEFSPFITTTSKKYVENRHCLKGKARETPLGVDILGHGRNKVQEDITSEFAIIMATGRLRAIEAVALATRRVMQRYRDHANVA
ncbi:desumoylating isopeptidase 1-like [Impatiens glandulifera]|uniref:desumoylating isopeptidase 1-like n=1 Tax=Impatiens glandulifera TaxID=253017 RepID=UPI001FB19C27|nr:desumoylating isopeptidase 1-like [Impatiens glandulifera]